MTTKFRQCISSKNIILAFFLLFSPLHAIIFEVKDLSKFEEEVCKLDKRSLVLFDIDFTILAPKDVPLKPCGKGLRRQYLYGLDPEKKELLQSIIALEGEEELMDKKMPSLIKKMQKIDWKPKKILFIDDSMDQLKSAELAARVFNIEFIGFHYIAAVSNSCELNQKLGELQFQNLVENEEWLTDVMASEVRIPK